MGQAYSGVGGTVLSGAVDLEVEEYSFEYESGEIDTTVTSDAGWEDSIHGVKKISGTFTFNLQASKTPFGATAGLYAPNYPTLTLGLGAGTASGRAQITKIAVASKTKEKITCVASFRSKGAWTLPA